MTDQSDLYEVSGTKTLPNGTITPSISHQEYSLGHG